LTPESAMPGAVLLVNSSNIVAIATRIERSFVDRLICISTSLQLF
jgi:hypothetical protein